MVAELTAGLLDGDLGIESTAPPQTINAKDTITGVIKREELASTIHYILPRTVKGWGIILKITGQMRDGLITLRVKQTVLCTTNE